MDMYFCVNCFSRKNKCCQIRFLLHLTILITNYVINNLISAEFWRRFVTQTTAAVSTHVLSKDSSYAICVSWWTLIRTIEKFLFTQSLFWGTFKHWWRMRVVRRTTITSKIKFEVETYLEGLMNFESTSSKN